MSIAVRPPSFLRVWLLVAALVTAAPLVLTYRSIQQSERSNAWVDQTQRTLSALVALEGSVADLIFASRQDTVVRAAAVALSRLDDLTRLTTDNERQQQRLERLRAEIDAIVRVDRIRVVASAQPAVALVPQSLSRVLREIRVEELDLLTRRIGANDRASRQLRAILAGTAAASSILLALVFGLVVRDERVQRRSQNQLERANQELDARVVARTTELNETLEREQESRRHAEAANRLKDEFLMTVSHELRTPLNALLGWADMLRLGIVSDGRRERAVQAIYENAKLQKQLIADLLDTSRILTGKLRIEPAVVDLGEIVRHAVNVVAPAADAKGLALAVTIDPHANLFVGDPGRLQQVVWNLVSNAVKFTNEGTVSVRLERSQSEQHLRIVVADSGIGIGGEFLPHVFDRFSQERTGTTRPHGGLGLGLAIVRQLVELHGGTVSVESGGAGAGATFTVSLPILPVRKHMIGAPQASEGLATVDETELPILDGVHVLVVDDEPSAREMATVTLEHCGAQVTAVGSAAEARIALARGQCDVLLLDIAMPGEDGWTLVRELRAQGLRAPIAALTALAHETDRVRALNAGFDMHLSKPIEAHALTAAVAAMVRAELNTPSPPDLV